MSGSTSGGGKAGSAAEKKKGKSKPSRTSMILWHAHQNDANAVRKLLEEDRTLVKARDYDHRTPLHVAALHGWIDVAKCLIEHGADVNAQDRWKNTVYFFVFICTCTYVCPLSNFFDHCEHGIKSNITPFYVYICSSYLYSTCFSKIFFA